MSYKNNGINKGTIDVKVIPFTNAMMAIFPLVFLEMIGSVVSIVVAPPGAMALDRKSVV